jgi:hypothetical protein
MANTYELITSSTVGSGGAVSVTFSSIANTWTDMVAVLSVRTNSGLATEQLYVTFDSSSTGYSNKQIYGDGSSAASASLSTTSIDVININTGASTSNTFSSTSIYIPNYASSNYKSTSAESVTENNATGALAGLSAGLWSNSAAISSITFANQDGSNFVQYSSFYLYGIKNS